MYKKRKPTEKMRLIRRNNLMIKKRKKSLKKEVRIIRMHRLKKSWKSWKEN